MVAYREFDGRGNVVLSADGRGYDAEDPSRSIGDVYRYDALDRQTVHISAQTLADNRTNGTDNVTMTKTYDHIGNVLRQTDANGNVTSFAYYLNGKLKEKVYPDGTKETYDYDLSGKAEIVKTDRAGHVTRKRLNIFDQPYRVT